MASSTTKGGGGDMKGFYREKKGFTNKPTPKLTAATPKTHYAGSSVTQPPLLTFSDEYDDVKEEEGVLRQFDINMKYGPCLGMSRLARWERASKLGMNPPAHIERLLKLPNASPECHWEGRV